MILGLGCSLLLCAGACAALGRSGRLLGYSAFAFSLSCMTVSVASREGGSRGFEVVASGFCLGSLLWSWISRRPFIALESVMALSFPSFFILGLFGLGLACLVTELPFKSSFYSHNCIFVLHMFNKSMKDKKNRKIGCCRCLKNLKI